MTRYLLGALLLISITNCGKTETVNPTEKSLASTWTGEQPNWVVDLTKYVVSGSFQMSFTYSTGGSCIVDAQVASINDPLLHDQESGTLILSNSQDLTRAPGMVSCAQFNGTWSYDLLEDQSLLLCLGNACNLYQ